MRFSRAVFHGAVLLLIAACTSFGEERDSLLRAGLSESPGGPVFIASPANRTRMVGAALPLQITYGARASGLPAAQTRLALDGLALYSGGVTGAPASADLTRLAPGAHTLCVTAADSAAADPAPTCATFQHRITIANLVSITEAVAAGATSAERRELLSLLVNAQVALSSADSAGERAGLLAYQSAAAGLDPVLVADAQWLLGQQPATDPVPLAPAQLTATSGWKQVALTWPASSGARWYRIFRTLPGGARTLLGTWSGTRYTDDTAVDGLTLYEVFASNEAGTSATAASASATPTLRAGTPWDFAAPALLTATVVADSLILNEYKLAANAQGRALLGWVEGEPTYPNGFGSQQGSQQERAWTRDLAPDTGYGVPLVHPVGGMSEAGIALGLDAQGVASIALTTANSGTYNNVNGGLRQPDSSWPLGHLSSPNLSAVFRPAIATTGGTTGVLIGELASNNSSANYLALSSGGAFQPKTALGWSGGSLSALVGSPSGDALFAAASNVANPSTQGYSQVSVLAAISLGGASPSVDARYPANGALFASFPTVAITQSFNTSAVDTSAAGTVFTLFDTTGATDSLFYARLDAGVFSGPFPVPGATGFSNSFHAGVLIDDAGNLSAIWRDAGQLYVQTRDAGTGTWSAPASAPLLHSGGGHGGFSVVRNGQDLWISWEELGPGVSSGFSSLLALDRFHHGGGFSTPVLLDSVDPAQCQGYAFEQFPAMAVTPDRLLLAWSSRCSNTSLLRTASVSFAGATPSCSAGQVASGGACVCPDGEAFQGSACASICLPGAAWSASAGCVCGDPNLYYSKLDGCLPKCPGAAGTPTWSGSQCTCADVSTLYVANQGCLPRAQACSQFYDPSSCYSSGCNWDFLANYCN